MPCHVDPPSPTEEHQKSEVTKQLDEINGKASRGADLLREYLLGNVAAERMLPLLNMPLVDDFDKLEKLDRSHWLHVDENYLMTVHELVTRYNELNEMVTITGRESLNKKTLLELEKEQQLHRHEDLRRLRRVFAEADDTDRLRKTLDADYRAPLAAQLGFDPDEF